MSDLDKRQTANNDLDGKGSSSVPAWKLREQMKKASHPTNHVRTPISSRSKLTPSDFEDPNLPPAFKAMQRAQRKKKGDDDFMSLDSVHSSKSHRSITQTPTTNNESDSFENDSDDSSSFDGHDSFASLGEDDDDDDAYEISRNLIAKQQVETNKSTTSKSVKNRLKKAGMGTLDLIAE